MLSKKKLICRRIRGRRFQNRAWLPKKLRLIKVMGINNSHCNNSHIYWRNPEWKLHFLCSVFRGIIYSIFLFTLYVVWLLFREWFTKMEWNTNGWALFLLKLQASACSFIFKTNSAISIFLVILRKFLERLFMEQL